ncbi:DUF2461 domain-containing protein [Plebeiibacterium sediminum]|uniref:DUF2461 domain-containing protein n=1 Tax=Plebeiibacterium sediminum TaxID=2992112 RepID=A0AAE3SGY0_9BACT|nr:DUF2461 domain-containing protein [Plebeiobacterium sediminum]MCW3788776.1 DUF2461 domain-containing protein [Plebeiobacterium sediminum]
MIPSTIFDFLKELTVNNNKEWFNDNKSKYQTAKDDFESYIDQLIALVHSIDPTIGHPHAKDCIFRIYRDVRFSKDKLPYKNNFGAYIAHGGRKSPYAGYYLHIEPDNSFIGGGIYCPQPKILKTVRESIMDNAEEYVDIIKNKTFKKTFPEIWGEKVKTAPKGFSKNDPNIDLIRPKSYALITNLTDEEILDPKFEKQVIKTFNIMKPFNDFLNIAIKKGLS